MTVPTTREPVAPPRRSAVLRGFAIGALLGAMAAGCIEAYFRIGPESGGADSGEALGLFLLLLGFPANMLAYPFAGTGWIEYALLILCLPLNWGMIGAVTAWWMSQRRG